MRTYAREYDEISKKQFSKVTSRGLQRENKIYKLKRSIAETIKQLQFQPRLNVTWRQI